MAEEDASSMNLDLNLVPGDNSNGGGDGADLGDEANHADAAINLVEWLRNPRRVREIVTQQRTQRWRSLLSQLPIPEETLNLAMEFVDGNLPPPSGGSEEAPPPPGEEVPKSGENGSGSVNESALKNDGGKNDDDGDGSFFDCNICFDLATDPVLTCCGHLFCWPCLYRWLHLHSDAKECPVCKGEVNVKNITPIYGRGNSVPADPADANSIPQRPQAQRVESWRQNFRRAAYAIPVEEMLRRIGGTLDLSWELSRQTEQQPQAQGSEAPSESLVGRIFTSRGRRRERTVLVPNIDAADSSLRNVEANSRRFSLVRIHRNAYFTPPAAATTPAPAIRSPDVSLSNVYYDNGAGTTLITPEGEWFEDQEALANIAAVMQSVTSALASDSLPTSSSRRRRDAVRTSEAEGEDSTRRPASRRRRLN